MELLGNLKVFVEFVWPHPVKGVNQTLKQVHSEWGLTKAEAQAKVVELKRLNKSTAIRRATWTPQTEELDCSGEWSSEKARKAL